eukprot:363518-Chlamydomonas_euryale.AAC.8
MNVRYNLLKDKIPTVQALNSVLPGLSVKGTFGRRFSNPLPRDRFSVWPGNLRTARETWCHHRSLPHGTPGFQSCTSQRMIGSHAAGGMERGKDPLQAPHSYKPWAPRAHGRPADSL